MNRITSVELVVVILLLGLLSSIAIPRILSIMNNSREGSTLREMQIIREAIVGNPDLDISGETIIKGYEGDVGSLPPSIEALFQKPEGVPLWNPYTRKGWNGPYVIDDDRGFLSDAWGGRYLYNPDKRVIKSVNPKGELVVGF